MSIGDVNSGERGSGARYNDGKIDLTLLPPWAWEELLDRADETGLRKAYYGREIALLGEFWLGKDDAIEAIIDGLTLDDWCEAASVFAYGAIKYARWNWAKGMPWSVPLACYLRHILLADPESADDESGISHRGHAVCNLVMMAHYSGLCRDMDDRPQELRFEFHHPDVEPFEDLPSDVIEAIEHLDRLFNPDAARSALRARVEERAGVDPDFTIGYTDEVGEEWAETLGDLPTSVLNELVEQSVEIQEDRERTLRASGLLV